MTPALPRITENMAAFWRSRGRLAGGLPRAVAAAGPPSSEESVCLIDFFLVTFVSCCECIWFPSILLNVWTFPTEWVSLNEVSLTEHAIDSEPTDGAK